MEKQWDLVRYHWEEDENGMPFMVIEDIVETMDDIPNVAELLCWVTNYVNEHEPHAKDFRWCNGTGDEDGWEYYQSGYDSRMTPVYSAFPTSERGLLFKEE